MTMSSERITNIMTTIFSYMEKMPLSIRGNLPEEWLKKRGMKLLKINIIVGNFDIFLLKEINI